MIKLEHVSKTYQLTKKQKKELQIQSNTVSAVTDVSLECKPGRVFSLLGPNGAGKTTTLRMIATILAPSSGHIEVNGVNAITNPQAVRREIGFLTGSTNLYDRLTPGEIVKYFADLYGLDKSTFKQRKEVLFDQLNIHEFSKKRFGQLSTGMKQKVSIARSMVHNPSVVIFDEPTSGLDVITANSIIELIRQCKKEGKTVIFSSHIMSEVDLLCDDLAIISKGSLVYSNSMDKYREDANGTSLTEQFIKIVNQNQLS